MSKKNLLIILFILLLLIIALFYLKNFNQSQLQSLRVYIVDVGSGLCVISELPNTHNTDDPYHIVYDTGYGCSEALKTLVPKSQNINLMVLSHNDTDHIATADDILNEYKVNKIIWSGFERPSISTWNDVNKSIDNAAKIINLKKDTLAKGYTEIYGETHVTYVSGYHVPPDEWGFLPNDTSEYRNAGSIVIRIAYKGKSILLTGDMIGRSEDGDQPDHHIIAHEKVVFENRFAVSIDSDVLVASHHGGNDASSCSFIQAVSPEYVIFSAGSNDSYGHPHKEVVERFLNVGVKFENIFRTDLGDDESKPTHWEDEKTIIGNSDPSGDDDILITINQDSKISVKYINL